MFQIIDSFSWLLCRTTNKVLELVHTCTYNLCFKHFAAYQFFERVTEEGALRVIDEEATLPDSRFSQICSELIQVVSGNLLVEESVAERAEPAGFIVVTDTTSLNIVWLHDRPSFELAGMSSNNIMGR